MPHPKGTLPPFSAECVVLALRMGGLRPCEQDRLCRVCRASINLWFEQVYSSALNRPSFEMKGGTVFHFVTEGIQAALDRALTAANGKDVRIGGGVSTIRQYMAAGLIDELHLALAPVFLGRGESLFEGMDWASLGYRCTGTVAGEGATHLIVEKV